MNVIMKKIDLSFNFEFLFNLLLDNSQNVKFENLKKIVASNNLH